MIKPLNDTVLVELIGDRETDKLNLITAEEAEGCESGIVVEISDTMPFFGSHGWSFDTSLHTNSPEGKKFMQGMQDWYKDLIGKRVYWEQYADRGTTIEHEGKKFAIVKLSKLIAVEE
jgi:co-chaperonin GroES (HSP10)